MEYENRPFYRDTWVEIDLDSISWNLARIKQQLPAETAVIAVVKANAYGHGDYRVAEAALKAGASLLAVAFLDEALTLRDKGIQAPILVLGATRARDARLAAVHHISLTVYEQEWLEEAAACLQPEDRLAVHLKVDTGMGRIGVRDGAELIVLEQLLRADSRFEFEGVYTHFSTADEPDPAYFEAQLALFQERLSLLSGKPKYIHCSNSAAALRYPAAHFNAVRIGIAMYGLAPSSTVEQEVPLPLREAFSLHSRLIHVKKLPKGEKVGYGAAYETAEEEWIGTLPIGYADGWIRRLQGQEVLINGRRAPLVGKICMDQCMVRLPGYTEPGTEVTLIGGQGAGRISVNEIADKLETINYEIPCLIGSRVPRIYKNANEPGCMICTPEDIILVDSAH
ncbi:alanine racemase [Paenibacillus pinistramenti]|uniref:alanine racemase n=1 Tax=Paenibacillus pinistramenti TaxID=1768003 RepID=UPI001108C40F|nr:alanine racemase [Paenibacillus pinistramenti]